MTWAWLMEGKDAEGRKQVEDAVYAAPIPGLAMGARTRAEEIAAMAAMGEVSTA